MKRLAERQNVIIILFIIGGALLILKAAHLQIIDSSYRDQAERTTLAKNTRYPARGMVYDRNGTLVVSNAPIYDIEAVYNNIDPKMDTTLFCKLLDIDKATFNERLNKNWSDIRYSKNSNFIFLNKIEPNVFSRFQEHLYKFPGFYPIVRNIRSYPDSCGAHVLGYLSEVNNQDLAKGSYNYVMGDLIGSSGLEKKYEADLRGEKGIEYMLKDNLGRDVSSYNDGRLDSFAVTGENLTLTLDIDLQKYGEQLMVNKIGAVIALEPSSGEILAMVSAPTFDPNLLSFSKKRGSAFVQLASDTLSKPLYNRAINAKYPPGSIFKPVFSLIALQHGITYPNRFIRCDGEYVLSRKTGESQGCHSHVSARNIQMAIQHSCNIYYYQLMREFLEQYGYTRPGQGMDTLMTYLERFGLGNKLGVDFPYENDGFLPYAETYDNMYSTEVNGWRSTYVLSLGIGQGEFQFTTLQMANLAAIIANRGYYKIPHLLKAYESSKEINPKYTVKRNVGIDREHFEPVIEGMRLAVEAGTARTAYSPDYVVCGKTGTSQNPHGDDHSVFIAFAPKDDPKIAIAVYVENAGWGASYGGPIAGLMIEKYLTGEISRRNKWMEERMLNADLINKEQL